MAKLRAYRTIERICSVLLAVVACIISLLGLRLQWGAAHAAAMLVLAIVAIAAGGWFVQLLFKVFDRCSQGCRVVTDTKSRSDDFIGRSNVSRSDWSGSASRGSTGSPKHV